MLVNTVALGRTTDFSTYQIGLTAAPPGSHSVRGVRRTEFTESDFDDEEYVIFSPTLQKISYLVEFEVGATPQAASKPTTTKTKAAPTSTTTSTTTSSKPTKPISAVFESTTTTTTTNQRDLETSDGSNFLGFTKPTDEAKRFKFSTTFSTSTAPPASFTSTFSPATTSVATDSALTFGSASSATWSAQERQEDQYRLAFLGKAAFPGDPNKYLINVMQQRGQFQFRALDANESSIPRLLTFQHNKQTPSINSYSVHTESQWRTNWSRFTHSQFDGLDWSNVFVAGGSVLCALWSLGECGSDNAADIDMFLYGLTAEQATRKVEEIYNVISRNTMNQSCAVLRTANAITILGQYPYRHTQIILRYVNDSVIDLFLSLSLSRSLSFSLSLSLDLTHSIYGGSVS
jgi:hypothetical protein